MTHVHTTVETPLAAATPAPAEAPDVAEESFEGLPPKRLHDIDAVVDRAAVAAEAFRRLDQEQVLRYNAVLPSTFMPATGYSAYVAPDKYAQLGRVVFGGREPGESRRRLFQGVEDLLDRLDTPRSFEAAGVARDVFETALPDLAMAAFQDLSNRTNPRMPLLSEITDLLRRGYDGRDSDAH